MYYYVTLTVNKYMIWSYTLYNINLSWRTSSIRNLFWSWEGWIGLVLSSYYLSGCTTVASYESERSYIEKYLEINIFEASITCSTISNIPYNLILTTKFNDSSILITIISRDYMNLSLADEHVGDVTIPTQVIEYNQNFNH
jgi:hypothetical protein